MQTFHSKTLTSATSKADQTKLVDALKAVRGVAAANLHIEKSEFEIKSRTDEQPKRDAILAAASKAGFEVSAPKK